MANMINLGGSYSGASIGLAQAPEPARVSEIERETGHLRQMVDELGYSLDALRAKLVTVLPDGPEATSKGVTPGDDASVQSPLGRELQAIRRNVRDMHVMVRALQSSLAV